MNYFKLHYKEYISQSENSFVTTLSVFKALWSNQQNITDSFVSHNLLVKTKNENYKKEISNQASTYKNPRDKSNS